MSIGESRQAVQAGVDKLQEAPVELLVKAWDEVGLEPVKEHYEALIAALMTLKDNRVATAGAVGMNVRGSAEAAQTEFSRVIAGGTANAAANEMVANTEAMRHDADTGISYAGIMAEEVDVILGGLRALHPTITSMENVIYRGRDSTDSVQKHANFAITAAETCRDTL